MKTKRDLSRVQFDAKLAKHGIRQTGFMGYCEIGHGCSVSRHNAGSRLRDQLRYLLKEQARVQAEHEARITVNTAEAVS